MDRQNLNSQNLSNLLPPEPRKKVHINEQQGERFQGPKQGKKKPEYILSHKLAQQLQLSGNLHEHNIDGKDFYFPYAKLNQPQTKFIGTMFQCLDQKKHLLIESPTGTGKTLSLLTGALAWADQYYYDSQGGTFQNRIKIIYTSRAHSQLSQISKQLDKTPYRPETLVFGSREKLCINDQVNRQINQKQTKNYDQWSHKCNVAVRLQQTYLQNPHIHQNDREITRKTIQQFKSKSKLTLIQRQELQNAQQHLLDLQLRCQHFHLYNSGQDASFLRQVGRQVLNSEKLKSLAKNRTPQSICPYFYPKRVKNRGTLYLMPYNYLLDARILQHSKGFIQNSIIIFDQGHNVPGTACEGYSMNFKVGMLQSAKRNIQQKLSQNDFDIDETQMQNFIRQDDELVNEQDSDQQMQGLMAQVRRRNREKQITQTDKSSLKEHVDWLTNLIKNAVFNFQSFFNYQRVDDFKKAGSSFLQTAESQQQSRKSNYKWQAVRCISTSDRQQIENLIESIFFSQRIQGFQDRTLMYRLQEIIKSLNTVVAYFVKKSKRCFKIVTLQSFYTRLRDYLYNPDYQDKFFFEFTQMKKYQSHARKNVFKGQIDIRCLAPQFAFKKLEKISPRSIIITSGTLSPMAVFQQQIGLDLVKQQVGHVITEDNIMVRKVARDLRGQILKIDSVFYSSRDGLQFGNLTALFRLLIKTVQFIPHGVLVIVSSFSCLKHLQCFYRHQRSRKIRQELEGVKPHVYFQPRKNVETTMERFNANSQQQKGALLFCVCRAKLSEGIDFKDRLCRSVIFLGIPYVNKGDPFIVEKGKYLKKKKSAYASDWRFIQAAKAINQGLGRAVRHGKDYGSILMFDSRYQQTNRDSVPVVANISEWIKKNWKANNDINELQTQLKTFYSKCQKQFPTPEQTQDGQDFKEYFKTKY